MNCYNNEEGKIMIYRDLIHIKFSGDVEQIYDIAVIPESTMPELLQGNNNLIRHIFDYKEDIK